MIIDKEINILKHMQVENRTPKSKQKEKGRISLPEELDHAQKQKKYMDLRRMPFSLNDEDPGQINSPFMKNILSMDGEQNDSGSLEVEMRHADEFYHSDDSNLNNSFEIFDEERHSIRSSYREHNEYEKYKQNNKVFDNANLYLNLSNKVSNTYYNRQTTAKTGNVTGANWAQTDSNQKLSYKAHLDNDLTEPTPGLGHKSYTTRKINFYSDIDQDSERMSNATHQRPSHGTATKQKRPYVVKGFCSSISSSKSQVDDYRPRAEETSRKYDFYNSGTAFHQQDEDAMTHKPRNLKGLEPNNEYYGKSE